eukprot:CAMPEP_0170595442 /NCGR_PEP_ID=MMETSP0224-20130122/14564_1 /TAXON_ID=285029 /ORGANISM="Togula jolla, Strain CCCM 725" /LENGTH=729 /DNA_ID=CAMNT_0010919623 /DNA_START=44 /DNA_END=2233 /DNA_ORIENTATION=+
MGVQGICPRPSASTEFSDGFTTVNVKALARKFSQPQVTSPVVSEPEPEMEMCEELPAPVSAVSEGGTPLKEKDAHPWLAVRAGHEAAVPEPERSRGESSEALDFQSAREEDTEEEEQEEEGAESEEESPDADAASMQQLVPVEQSRIERLGSELKAVSVCVRGKAVGTVKVIRLQCHLARNATREAAFRMAGAALASAEYTQLVCRNRARDMRAVTSEAVGRGHSVASAACLSMLFVLSTAASECHISYSDWAKSLSSYVEEAKKSGVELQMTPTDSGKVLAMVMAIEGCPVDSKIVRRGARRSSRPVFQEPESWESRVKVAAVTGLGSAATLGAAGGATGFLLGGASGAALGVIPAIFTFGLSIPVGAALGSGAGLMAGTAVGSSIGAAAGSALGYTQGRELERKASQLWGAVSAAAGIEKTWQLAQLAQLAAASAPFEERRDASAYTFLEEVKESPSYPGIQSLYRTHLVTFTLRPDAESLPFGAGLLGEDAATDAAHQGGSQEDFDATGKLAICRKMSTWPQTPEGTKRIDFAWVWEHVALEEVRGGQLWQQARQHSEIHRVSSVLLGLEGSAPQMRSPFGTLHDASGSSSKVSAVGNRKWRAYRVNSALQIPSDEGGIHVKITRQSFDDLVEACRLLDLSDPQVDLLRAAGAALPRRLLDKRFQEQQFFRHILGRSGPQASRAVEWMLEHECTEKSPEAVWAALHGIRRFPAILRRGDAGGHPGA